MVDLKVDYLGLELKNPIVAGASPFTKRIDAVKLLEDSGVGAVVVYSLFEEQIWHESQMLDQFLNTGAESQPEAVSYFPDLENYNIGPDGYLDTIRKLKETVDVPVIGSLNGYTSGGWINYAKLIEEAGADALELNIYYLPTELETTGQELEDAHLDLVTDMRKQIHIPLAVKLSPYFSALPNLAASLVKAGANGLVLFNRFMQPDLDIETLRVIPTIDLSDSSEMRLPLRWTAVLYGKLQADLALTTGAHTAVDVIKAVMAGASAVQMVSELIANGPQRVAGVLKEIEEWMEKFEYETIHQMLGAMSQQAVANPSAFERANYMKVLASLDHKIL
jgi:dihydroorotate dehydrogenase (fumarate)